MEQFSDDIFQQLISDTQFIRWAKGKPVQDGLLWENWKEKNSGYITEFDEAVAFVKKFSFYFPKISDSEIWYMWDKTFVRINGQKSAYRLLSAIRYLGRVAAILFIPLLIYTAWLTIEKYNPGLQHITGIPTYQEVTVFSPIGARSVVDLPDGSKAWLNSGSSLSYSPVFKGKERKVKVDGEAYFKVKKDHIPFIVENLGPEVKVYGTEFNVNSYSDEPQVTVALAEGKVHPETVRHAAPGGGQ